MSLGQVVLLLYSIVLFTGGMIGKKAGSTVSLIAGGASGLLVSAAFVVSFVSIRPALWMGAAVASLLVVVFWMRYQKTRKVVPSGVLLILSLCAAIIFVIGALGSPAAGSGTPG